MSERDSAETRQRESVVPEGFGDLLAQPLIVHLATVREDGQPQTNPMLFEWDGERVRMSITKSRKKYANVRGEPRVAISVTDPENPYRYLELRGTIDLIEEDVDNAFVNSQAKRYLGQDEYTYDPPGAERIVISFVPDASSHQGAPN